MDRRSLETLIAALNAAEVRYLIVGGLAVIAHGYLRFTADVDLILDLREENVRRAVAALGRLGYRSRVPVPFDHFIDAEERSRWVREKGLTVFSVFSNQFPATLVDLFVEAPLDFDQAYAAADRMELAPGVEATFISLADLLELKRQAGRPKDLEDIRRLQVLMEAPEHV